MTTDSSGIRVTRLTDDEPATAVQHGLSPAEHGHSSSLPAGRSGRPVVRNAADLHETKPFFRTSEFLVAALTMLALLVAGYLRDDTLTTWRTWLLVTVVAAAYIVSRGIAKAGSADRH